MGVKPTCKKIINGDTTKLVLLPRTTIQTLRRLLVVYRTWEAQCVCETGGGGVDRETVYISGPPASTSQLDPYLTRF